RQYDQTQDQDGGGGVRPEEVCTQEPCDENEDQASRHRPEELVAYQSAEDAPRGRRGSKERVQCTVVDPRGHLGGKCVYRCTYEEDRHTANDQEGEVVTALALNGVGHRGLQRVRNEVHRYCGHAK